MLVPIFLAQAGSAARPPVTKFEICVQNAGAPTCGGTATSVFAGNTVATVSVSVENDGASTTAIQSANVVVPNQLKVVQGTGSPTDNVSTSNQTIEVRGVKVQPGKSFTATFQVDVACNGQFAWSSLAPDQQAYSGDNLTGSTFTYQPGSSTGVSTSVTTSATVGCHLAFVAQPTDTQTGMTIRDGGASDGDPITVGLFLGTSSTPMSTCPLGYSTCDVDVASTPAGVDGTTTQPLVGGNLASFGDLSITNSALATQYNLTATGNGGFASTVRSSSFLIAQDVTPLLCPGSSCASNGHQQVSGAQLADSFVDVTSSNGFTFMTLSPFTLVGAQPHAGCQGLAPLNVTGFAESDNRLPGSGTLTIRYYVNKDILSARYGKNVGNQFAPMCVGARPVDPATGAIHDCNEQGPWNTGGWVGDAIASGGKFTGKTATAVCDADGYYWGIISSYQDKLDAVHNPTVTNWGGTQINGDNYRFFDMNIPSGWDYRGGP
jgi:hypothetical protein